MPKILVIEDDPDLAEAMGEFLASGNYRVRYARDGAQALQMLKAETADLIVLDLMMPGMNGWEFRDHQGSDPNLAGIPVLVLSALDRQQSGIDAAAYMRKPFRPEELLKVVKRLVRKRDG